MQHFRTKFRKQAHAPPAHLRTTAYARRVLPGARDAAISCSGASNATPATHCLQAHVCDSRRVQSPLKFITILCVAQRSSHTLGIEHCSGGPRFYTDSVEIY